MDGSAIDANLLLASAFGKSRSSSGTFTYWSAANSAAAQTRMKKIAVANVWQMAVQHASHRLTCASRRHFLRGVMRADDSASSSSISASTSMRSGILSSRQVQFQLHIREALQNRAVSSAPVHTPRASLARLVLVDRSERRTVQYTAMQACPNFSSFEAVGGNGRYSGRVSLRSWQAGETYTLRWPPGGCVLSDSMRSDKYSKLLAMRER